MGKAARLSIYRQDAAYRSVFPLRQVALAQLYKNHHQSGDAASGKLVWKRHYAVTSHNTFIFVVVKSPEISLHHYPDYAQVAACPCYVNNIQAHTFAECISGDKFTKISWQQRASSARTLSQHRASRSWLILSTLAGGGALCFHRHFMPNQTSRIYNTPVLPKMFKTGVSSLSRDSLVFLGPSCNSHTPYWLLFKFQLFVSIHNNCGHTVNQEGAEFSMYRNGVCCNGWDD